MRVFLQRTKSSEVWIAETRHAQVGFGLTLLFGTKTGDTEASCRFLADKVVNLRIFEDEQGKMNLSALDIGAEILIISQFTLYADWRKGRRPAFTDAMEPVAAERMYELFVAAVRQSGLRVETGVFGAKMDIHLVNHGPVSLQLEHDAE